MVKFTRYPPGSIREMGIVSLPLMISILASLCMLFIDRLFLAHYSMDALNASVNAGTFAWTFIGSMGIITSMSEVFVAQYNGASDYRRIGSSVWQMVWLAGFSYLIFIPLFFLSGHIFPSSVTSQLESVYFRYLMLFGPSYPLGMAVAGFFIGRGETKVLVWVAIGQNLLNIILDWLFIFGFPPYIPEMGIKGAALATCAGYLFTMVTLLLLFWKKKHREKFGTCYWQFNFTEFRNCCRIGMPQGIFYGIELLAWTIFFWMMASLSKLHITTSSICQTFLILLSFFPNGLRGGVAAISGNYIGAKFLSPISRMMKSGVILNLLFSITIFCFLFFIPQLVPSIFFIENNDGIIQTQSLRISLFFTVIYIFFEGIRLVFAGLLAAAGDVYFLLVAGSLLVWAGFLLPVYVFVIRQNLPVEYAWFFAALYSCLLCSIYAFRFNQGAWKQIDLVKESKDLTSPNQESLEQNR